MFWIGGKYLGRQEVANQQFFILGLNYIYNVLKISANFSLEPRYDKTFKMICATSEDSDQPGHPYSLIRVFDVRKKKAWVLSYP